MARDVHLDLQLHPGAPNEVVEVTDEAPLVETTNDTLGGTFTNKAINDLPLNGRDFQNLVVLRPGVQRYPGGGFLSISSNGNLPEDNNVIIDGVDNNDYKFDEGQSGSLVAGKNFGIVTNIVSGPDGSLFVTSLTKGAVYMIH